MNAPDQWSRLQALLRSSCPGMAIPDRFSLDGVLPLIEQIRLDGGVFFIKFDGERGDGDNGPYTVGCTQGKLGDDDYLKAERFTLEEAVSTVLAEYLEFMS